MIDKKTMDSDEERDFYEWLCEAEFAGLVSEIRYHPGVFILSERVSFEEKVRLKTKIKIVDRFLLHPHKYSPDFAFVWHGIFNPFTTMQDITWIDVKGTFGQRGDTKQFTINQKWVYQKFGIYVNKTIPEKLFKKTWVPGSCRRSPVQRKLIKKYRKCITIDEYLGEKI